LTTMPIPGSRFLGFQIDSELGRGAFGRVYLALQGELADRPVALKGSADVARETHALAELQHTNIVPIYSVHRKGPLQAVCMRYLGSTTLADVLREVRQSQRLPDSGAGLLSSHKTRPRLASTSATVGSEALPSSPNKAVVTLEAAQPATIRLTAQVER